MQSKYENLPVYKKALELTVYFEKTVMGFSRYHKYTLGADLRNLSREILVLIAKANIREGRIDCLKESIQKLEELKVLIHICKEVKAFKSFNSFEFSIKSIIEVLRQCEGWLRSQNPSNQGYLKERANEKSLGAHSTQRV